MEGGSKEDPFNVDDFSQKGFKAMVAATRAFQCLPPPGPLWDLRKSYPEFSRGLKGSRNRLITSMVKLLKHAKLSPDDFRRRDVDEKFDFIVDSNDEMLERIATSLDKAEGLFKRTEIVVVNPSVSANVVNPPGTWNEKKFIRLNNAPATEEEAVQKPTGTPRTILKPRYRNRVREKPQLRFSTPVDNSTNPFIPKLREKPNSIKPLSVLPEYNDNNEEFYGHPYKVELNQWKPAVSMLKTVSPKFPVELDKTPLKLVESGRDMEKMLDELASATEIAVDLEHHSYRSFLGLTCTIQISTRTHDYVIDGLSLRDDIHHLNGVFTNPHILKVFHGANSDIEWLQKDFGVYVVGMFDTSVAAKLLNFSQTSLQFLLTEICSVSTDKSFQIADWRIRPLPAEMLQYARIDTHYLLYIYDVLKTRLLEAGNSMDNLIQSVYDQSRMVCLKRFEKPSNNPQVALRKSKRSFNNRQLYCFTELFKWRDAVAREKDESLGYVLPNHMLLTIAETLPKEMTGIMACCDPVPQLVHINLGHIHRIVLKARELPMHDVSDTSIRNKSQKKVKQRNWMMMMNSVYEVDLNEHDAGQNDLDLQQSLNKNKWNVDWSEFNAKPGPAIKFNCSISDSDINNVHLRTSNEVAPYQRYRITNEIIEKFKDPKKKVELDMTDPRVKAVVETIMVDPFQQVQEEEDETTSTPSKKPLFDMDFVPFNPMSVPKGTKKGKKRKKAAGQNHEYKVPKTEQLMSSEDVMLG